MTGSWRRGRGWLAFQCPRPDDSAVVRFAARLSGVVSRLIRFVTFVAFPTRAH
jgi:hypothetical protein